MQPSERIAAYDPNKSDENPNLPKYSVDYQYRLRHIALAIARADEKLADDCTLPERQNTLKLDRERVQYFHKFLTTMATASAPRQKVSSSPPAAAESSLSLVYFENKCFDRFAKSAWFQYYDNDGEMRWEHRTEYDYKWSGSRFVALEERPRYFDPKRYFPEAMSFVPGQNKLERTLHRAMRSSRADQVLWDE